MTPLKQLCICSVHICIPLHPYKYSASENDLTDFTIQREKDFLLKQNVTALGDSVSLSFLKQKVSLYILKRTTSRENVLKLSLLVTQELKSKGA